MEILKMAFAGLLVLFGLFIIGCSWARQIHNSRARNDPNKGWSSPAPFVGPILCIVGYGILPVPFSNWVFLLFALDLDTVITLAGIFYLLSVRVRRRGA